MRTFVLLLLLPFMGFAQTGLCVHAQNTDYTITAADVGCTVTSNIAATYTLPRAGTVGFEFSKQIIIMNTSTSGVLTLRIASGSVYGLVFSKSTAAIGPGQSILLQADTPDWRVVSYSLGGVSGSVGPAGSGNNTYCADATGSTTTYTCPSPTPAVTTLTGLIATFRPQATNTGSSTLNVAGLGVKTLKKADGTTNFASGELVGGTNYSFSYDGTNFVQTSSAGSGSNPVVPAVQFSIPYYKDAGTSTTLDKVASPPATNGTYSVQYPVTGGVAVQPVIVQDGLSARAITGTTATDTILYSDVNTVVSYKGSVAVAVTLPTATTLNNPLFALRLDNVTTGTPSDVTVTPTTWTINGASTLVIKQGQNCMVIKDPASSTNWVSSCADRPGIAGTNVTITRTAAGPTYSSTGGGNPSVGAQFHLQMAGASTGTFDDAICTASVSPPGINCGTDFGAGGACIAPGSVATPSAGSVNYFCDSTNGNHYSAKTSTPTVIDLQNPRIKTCTVAVGDPGSASPVLADDNDTPSGCTNDLGVDWTITSVSCLAPSGSPTVTPILTGGSGTSVLSGALTCSSSWAAGTISGTPVVHSFSGATCSSTPCAIDANITTAGGTAKYLVIKIVGTY